VTGVTDGDLALVRADPVEWVDVTEVHDDVVDLFADEQRRRRRDRAPGRLSMSTMRRGEACELAMYLQRVTGDVAGPEAIAGRAFHEVADAIAFRARMTGQATITTQDAVAIAGRVLARLSDPLRGPERAQVLEWVAAWAPRAAFPVNADDFLVETLWTHDLEFHTLSARLDLVARTGTVVEIRDYKTGHPPRDPSYITDAFQPKNYAWHAARAFPDAELFEVTEDYVRGRPLTVMYDREDCETWIEDWLAALAARLGRAWASGRFTAQPGSWCARCPAPHRCTLPEDARPASAQPVDQLTARANALKVLEARAKRERDALRTLVDVFGLNLPVGDQELGFADKTKRVVPGVREARTLGIEQDRAAALDALEAIKIDKTAPEFGWHKRQEGP
jgi:hypothetical protein